MPKIYVTRRPPESAVALLHDAFGAENVAIYAEDRPIPREVLLAGVQGADAILSSSFPSSAWECRHRSSASAALQ